MSPYDTEDEQLDPAAERLRAKLARLLLVSSLVMMLGFIAVFAAIVYKLGFLHSASEPSFAELAAPSATLSRPPGDARLRLPAGAQLVSADLDGDRALLNLRTADGATLLLLVDIPSGTVLNRIGLAEE
jgi:hypothetical protein